MKTTLSMLRAKQGMSLKDASVILGVSCKTLKSYEQKRSVPTIEFAFKAAALYAHSIDDIEF